MKRQNELPVDMPLLYVARPGALYYVTMYKIFLQQPKNIVCDLKIFFIKKPG